MNVEIKDRLYNAWKYMKHPEKVIVDLCSQYPYHFASFIPDKIFLKCLYKLRVGKKLNLKEPKTYTEKLNWLKLYDRKPEYTIMVDKYLAREFIEEKIGAQYLVPLIGHWNSVDEIPFDSFPDKFVLKCNHDNGVIVCTDKRSFKIESAKTELKQRLSRDYFMKGREWPYKNVKRVVICEEFMENTNGENLVDYKLFCFNGVPQLVMVNSNRFGSGGVKTDMYDMEWNHLNMQDGHYPFAGDVFEKPQCFEEMVFLAQKISEGTAFLRVDFNYWDNRLYFGELTFYHQAGFTSFLPEKWDEVLGEWIELPKKSVCLKDT